MTIFTETPVRQSALSEFQAPLSDALATTFEDALYYSPLWSAQRSGDLTKAQEGEPRGPAGIFGRYPPATEMMRPEDARQRVRDAGVELSIPDEGIRAGALDILIERKKEEKRRNDVLSRAPTGFLAGTARLGATLLGTAADPLNIAAAFIPVLREGRYAALVGRAGSAFGRAGVRAAVGMAEGAVGAAVVEPIIYLAARQEQADYDLSDSLLNIGVGAILGGGLHVGVGAIGDAVSWRSARAQEPLPKLLEELDFPGREAVLRRGLSQALASKPVDVTAMLAAQARRILAKEAPAAASVRAPVSLTRFVAAHGGIADFQGELRALDLDKAVVPGVGKLVRENGRPLDYAREAAAEAGYFDHIYGDPATATARSTIADFLNLLEQDARGSPVYSSADTTLVEGRGEAQAARETRTRLRQNLDQLTALVDTTLPDAIMVDAARLMDEGVSADDALERAIIRDYQMGGDSAPIEVTGLEENPVSAPARDSADAQLSEVMDDLERLTDALGVPEYLDELYPFDELIDTAAVYGRAIEAAASCQLRRGA